jgi:integrase/recombinase XerC
MMPVRKYDYPYRDLYSKHLLVIRGLTEQTFKNYSREIELFLGFIEKEFGEEICDPLKIEPIHIIKYLNSVGDRRGDPLAIRYRILIALRSYYDFLDRYNYLKDKLNPVLRFKLKQPRKKLPIYLTLDEAERFLAAANTGPDAVRDHAIFRFFLQTGCRMVELLSLRLDSSFDFDNKKVRIIGKGDKERMLKLSENTCQALQLYLTERKPFSAKEQAVFLNFMGLPISAGEIRNQFKMICDRAELTKPGLTVHKLRHSCLTMLLNAGVDLVTLKYIAGHETIRTTAQYLHVTQQQLRAAVEKHPFG